MEYLIFSLNSLVEDENSQKLKKNSRYIKMFHFLKNYMQGIKLYVITKRTDINYIAKILFFKEQNIISLPEITTSFFLNIINENFNNYIIFFSKNYENEKILLNLDEDLNNIFFEKPCENLTEYRELMIKINTIIFGPDAYSTNYIKNISLESYQSLFYNKNKIDNIS